METMTGMKGKLKRLYVFLEDMCQTAEEKDVAILSLTKKYKPNSVIASKGIVENLKEAKRLYVAAPTVQKREQLKCMASVCFLPRSGGPSSTDWEQKTSIRKGMFETPIAYALKGRVAPDRTSTWNPWRPFVEEWANEHALTDSADTADCEIWRRTGPGYWISHERRYRRKTITQLYHEFLVEKKIGKSDMSLSTFEDEFNTTLWYVSKKLPQQCLNEDDEKMRNFVETYVHASPAFHRHYYQTKKIWKNYPPVHTPLYCEHCMKNSFLTLPREGLHGSDEDHGAHTRARVNVHDFMKCMLCEKGLSTGENATAKCSNGECNLCGWDVRFKKICPAEDDESAKFNLNIRVHKETGRDNKKEWTEEKQLHTPKSFMTKFKEHFKVYAKRYFRARIQKHAFHHQSHEYLKDDLDCFAMHWDW
jgi:hypothetical protein